MPQILGKTYSTGTLVLTVAIGIAGVIVARAIGAPLPFMFGSVVAVGAAAVARLEIGGARVAFPSDIRSLFVPVIGVAIGGSFTPALLAEAGVWAPSLLALVLYIPGIHLAGFLLCHRIGGFDPATAWYGSMPGGFIEAITMGEERGAEVALLTALQFLRLVLCILLVPLAFTLIEGGPVGSAAGVQLPGAERGLTLPDAAILTACGVGGWILSRRLPIPAAVVAWPMLLSGAAHLTGIVQGHPPAWLVQATQFVIGLTLGVRFSGIARGALVRAAGISASIVVGTLLVAALAGWLLGALVEESVAAVVLAFSPGGLVEMTLVALSLGLSTVYVTAHHVLRILLAVAFARLAGDAVLARIGRSGGRPQ